MAIAAVKLTRVFKFNGSTFTDPNPAATPAAVQALLAHHDPAIASAAIEGPQLKRDQEIYTFRLQTGSKG